MSGPGVDVGTPTPGAAFDPEGAGRALTGWPVRRRVAADGAVRPGAPGGIGRLRGVAPAARLGVLGGRLARPCGLLALALLAVLAPAPLRFLLLAQRFLPSRVHHHRNYA